MEKVIWKNDVEKKPPILFKREAVWNDFKIRHLRVLEGEMRPHSLSTHEISVTLAGNLLTERQVSNGKHIRGYATEGSVCLIPAGRSVSAKWQDEFEHLAINLKPEFVSNAALEMNLSPNFELKEIVSQPDPLIQHLSLALLTEIEKKEASSTLYKESLAHTLMFHLLQNYSTADVGSKNFLGGLSGYKLRRVTEFINENLENDLSLTEVAEVAGLSQFHFARAFRKTMGVTPQKFITNRRIEKAKELLAKSDLPIVEVGFRTGFKNQSHFTTLFRKFTSLTPKIWREAKQN